MDYNAGFARANNAGINASEAPVILLLNPDTLDTNASVQKCYSNFIKDPYIACGVQLLNVDGTPQISGNYAMKGGLNYLLPLPYLGDALKYFGNKANVAKPNLPDAKELHEVDWINGAFLMVKRSAINKAGLLDEDFFLYAEEAEWCSRLKKAGRLCIYGQYNIIHLQGETSNKTFDSITKGYMNLFDKKGLQILVSNMVRIRKQFGIFWYLFILFMHIVEIPIFFFGYLISSVFRKSLYTMKMVSNYTSNVFYLLKLMPTIIQNKPHFYKVL